MLNYEVPEDVERVLANEDDDFWGAWKAYSQAMTDAGVIVGGDPLQPSSMGTTIRVRDGKRDVQDGPYADTKEQLGGYIVLELPSLDEAIEWAARSPVAALGAVEIRPLSDTVAQRCRELVSE
ncbi:MAG: YciI family protein [Pirellulales bacterium]|nr:YciI family protein [Pirellulales bacterium]